jgi:hypothetical protein
MRSTAYGMVVAQAANMRQPFFLLVLFAACGPDASVVPHASELTCDVDTEPPPPQRAKTAAKLLPPLGDSDGDGVGDLRERLLGTNPFDPDT